MRLEGRYSDPVVIVYLFQCTSKREHVKIDINVKFDSSNLPLSIRLKTRQCLKDFYFTIPDTPDQPKTTNYFISIYLLRRWSSFCNTFSYEP